MPELVTAHYNDLSVTFTEAGWFNATIVAERFGKRPNDWLALDSTKEYIAVLAEISKCEESSLLKTRRGGDTRKSGNAQGTWLHPDLAVPFARWLDLRFSVWCDQQIKAILTGTHPHYDWKRLRHEATASFKVMAAVLQLQRQNQGKTSAPHHFINESKLVNWALTGAFQSIDREALSGPELDLLAKLEERNAVLLGCGLGREERKLALERFSADWRGARTPRLAVVPSTRSPA